MATHHTVPAESWEAYKSTIHELYISKGCSLDYVMSTMRARGFRASKPQFKRQLQKWQFSKNQKAEEWRYISRAFTNRSLQGKPSIVFMHGLRIPPEKVRKETRRHDLPSLMPLALPTRPMHYIRVCTPPSPISHINRAASASNAPQHLQVEKLNQRLTPITVSDLPSMEFMDLLDLNGKASTVKIFLLIR